MEEPVNYYDDYKNHITSKLSNEISKLFNVLKQDTISSKLNTLFLFFQQTCINT